MPEVWATPYGNVESAGRRIIRRNELQRIVPFSMVHIWRLEKRGEFPKRIQLGPNSCGWFADEVAAWCGPHPCWRPGAKAQRWSSVRKGAMWKHRALVE